MVGSHIMRCLAPIHDNPSTRKTQVVDDNLMDISKCEWCEIITEFEVNTFVLFIYLHCTLVFIIDNI